MSARIADSIDFDALGKATFEPWVNFDADKNLPSRDDLLHDLELAKSAVLINQKTKAEVIAVSAAIGTAASLNLVQDFQTVAKKFTVLMKICEVAESRLMVALSVPVQSPSDAERPRPVRPRAKEEAPERGLADLVDDAIMLAGALDLAVRGAAVFGENFSLESEHGEGLIELSHQVLMVLRAIESRVADL